MLETIFLKLLNISITASWLVLALILFRIVFRRAPRAIHAALWALVGIRLVCPFSLESIFSLVPSAETIPQDIMYMQKPEIHSGVAILNSTINPILESNFTPNPWVSANPLQIVSFVVSSLWVFGMIGMILYTFLSYWKIQRKVREAIPVEHKVWICDQVETPFILGVFRPQIYLPANLSEEEQKYVLAHEHAHISRRDHWWKPLGFLILTVYWFNPILWLAYILLCRDIELACDEKVITQLGHEAKKTYSMALLNCSVSRRNIAACPLAFGEVNVKNRIKSILNYKKPAFWLILITIVVSVVLAVSFLTDPVTTDVNRVVDEMGYDILEQREYVFTATISKDILSEEAFTEEGQSFKKDEVIVYATDTTNVYLEQVFLSNDNDEYLCMMFNCSYHDLDKHESVLLPYTKSDKGYTGTIRLKSAELADGMVIYDEALSLVGRGPSEKFSIVVKLDIAQSAFRYMSFKFVGNELVYANESGNSNEISHREIMDFDGPYRIFQGKEVVYGTRMIDSFVYFDNTMPTFVLQKENVHLLSDDFPDSNTIGSYYDIGQIQKLPLELSTLEHLLDDEFNPWSKGYSAEELYRKNLNTYMVTEEGQEYNRFYYILEQKNGDVYIAFGWAGEGIRYIFKTEEVKKSVDFESVTYVHKLGEQWNQARLTLNTKEKSFQYIDSLVSSYLAYGTYRVEGEELILEEYEGRKYVFKIIGEELVYNGDVYRKVLALD